MDRGGKLITESRHLNLRAQKNESRFFLRSKSFPPGCIDIQENIYKYQEFSLSSPVFNDYLLKIAAFSN
jgi:hypothetical protein